MSEIIEQEFIVNGENKCFLTGYIGDVKETKNDKGIKTVTFMLCCVHLSREKEQYDDWFKVTFSGVKAESFTRKWKKGDYVHIQGIMRQCKGLDKYKIIGVHCKGAEQVKIKLKIKVPKED